MGEEVSKKKRRNLEYYVKNYAIFVDTCSILHAFSYKFWPNITPLLKKFNKKLIIPHKCIQELEKHAQNPKLQSEVSRAQEALLALQKDGLLDIRGEAGDNFADNVFYVVFSKFRLTNDLLLITQDNDLASDIWELNNIKSSKSRHKIAVKRINAYGFLSNLAAINKGEKPTQNKTPKTQNAPKPQNVQNSPRKAQNPQNESKASTKGAKIQEYKDDTFCLKKQVTSLKDEQITVSYYPSEGDEVIAVNSKITLGKKLAEGGEGAIYETNTPYVAKIYKKENNTKLKYEKIKLMLSKEIKQKGICFPVAKLFNLRDEFIGYLMPKAQGKELGKSIFVKPLFLKNFPEWKKRDTVELCITILKKIAYLHSKNIIIGDINPANILVVSQKEVYFVDTDSYQIEDFPCPVGTINYTAPEIQRKHFSGFLRTLGNENFAVATLLFMIMLPGKPPYSQQGGEDPVSNIINMDFSYPFGDNTNKKTPDGPWRYIWSHLTYNLKEAFYETFRMGGKYAVDAQRLGANEWLSLFKDYLRLLDSGRYAKQDEMSLELFPTRFKKNPKTDYIVCRLCKNEMPEDMCKSQICRSCLDSGEQYKCKKCSKPILYTNYQRYIKKSKKFDICYECKEYGQQPYTSIICASCYEEFSISNNEAEFYAKKGFSLPKRCKSCRQGDNSVGFGGFFGTSKKKSSQKSLCYISTVVCDYFGLDDDCYELERLRGFRDGFLRASSGGIELIDKYYATAPQIANYIAASSEYDVLCKHLWRNFLAPCIKFIENNQNLECKNLYIQMYEFLSEKFKQI